MKHAFPEDELRPISCKPLHRDRENPAHVELNDVLGNYSVTLIDSLSTLAILASNPSGTKRNKPLLLFQNGIKRLVELYGDGTDGPAGQGARERGFNVDSKVQVFETVIRGVGGLLSAHLFAVGELPIRGYHPPAAHASYARAWDKSGFNPKWTGIRWRNGFVYDGQLLRLAHDLGRRIIPAFFSPTGIPYPRVNLRRGIPFYPNSLYNFDADQGNCSSRQQNPVEITETCSAGAGSLVLEFTLLSRLTGDGRFEELAKRAFWAVWSRRSDIGLIGTGIDAETGQWIGSSTGIGAGVDSFFEYALKSHILLSRGHRPDHELVHEGDDPRVLFAPLMQEEESGESFLQAWVEAHTAIERHLYRGPSFQHPHYIQADLVTGATRAFWIDSLSAYYPGLLVLSGHLEEATQVHLLATAVWTRFSALPERWNVASGGVEGGLSWWPGRPEFIESTFHLYRATQDPWYIHVGEMVLRDIKRRCWTRCGWAGLQDVRSGEQSDRMESFFLGETAKYLFLLFDPSHPLNHLDEPFVFTTEGHPIVIPRNFGTRPWLNQTSLAVVPPQICPKPPPAAPLSLSATAARDDIFHAAALARLHLMPPRGKVASVLGTYAADHPSISLSDLTSPSNYTFFPWTLPPHLVPQNGTSAPMAVRPTLDIAFPSLPNSAGQPSVPLQQVRDGILVNFIGGLRLSLIRDFPVEIGDSRAEGYRIQVINNFALGRDEKVFLPRDMGQGVLNPSDPNFTRVRDSVMLDLVIDLETPPEPVNRTEPPGAPEESSGAANIPVMEIDTQVPPPLKSALSSLIELMTSFLHPVRHTRQPLPSLLPTLDPAVLSSSPPSPNADRSATVPPTSRFYIPAIIPVGVGAAPLPDWDEAPSPTVQGFPALPPSAWRRVLAAGTLCTDEEQLGRSAVRDHDVLLVRRGGCSFSQKLKRVPNLPPGSAGGLQLVVVVSFDPADGKGDDDDDDNGGGGGFVGRPSLEERQSTPAGLPRQHPVPMVMVAGGERTYQALQRAAAVGIKRRYTVEAQGVPIGNLIIV